MEDLHHSYSAVGGEAGLQDYHDQIAAIIQQLLSATLAKRPKLLQAIADRVTLHCVLLCCHRLAVIAHLWLEQIQAQNEQLEWSKPSRKTAAEAAVAAMQFLENLPSYWPYEDDD